MDLSQLVPTERVIDIVHPKTGEQTGLKITLVSVEDDKLKTIKRKFLDAKLKAESKGKSLKHEEIEEFDNNMIYAAMTGRRWSGDATYNSEKPECNYKNVRKVVSEVYWIKSQILEALGDETAFLPD